MSRRTARIIPVSPAGRVLVLGGYDPGAPGREYWFSIGGGIEPGESAEDAALRELGEETGLSSTPTALIGPFHRGTHEYVYAGTPRRSESTFFTMRLNESVVVQPEGLADEIITKVAWWSPDDLAHMSTSHPALADVARLAVLAAVVGGTRD